MRSATPGLGRRFSPDERDSAFPMSRIVQAETPTRAWRYWHQGGWWGDQGAKPQCVAYAWLHWLEDGPVTHRDTPPPVEDPTATYRAAQRIDEWPGESYDGTSVRAGAKVLKQLGYISSYLWAWDAPTVIRAVLTSGPVVMGTWWYDSMFRPDADGFVRVAGSRVGGHAWVVNGVNVERGVVRCKNSWGREWGRRGNFWLSIADLDRLISEQGEACIASERRLSP